MSKSNQHDPDGTLLPIKVDSTSNGEYEPLPLERRNVVANAEAHKTATDNAKRLGMKRRGFLTSMVGAASTLLTFNAVNAAAGKKGGFYDLPEEAGLDVALADDILGKKDFIFDIQGHHVGDYESWRTGIKNKVSPGFKFFAPHYACDYANKDDDFGHVACLTGDSYIKEVFMDSDTDMAVLSIGPLYEEQMLPTYSEAAATRDAVAALEGTKRLLIHGRCMPTYQRDLDTMQEVAETWNISAWKSYTQFGPNRTGYYLDDDIGQKFIDSARKTGVKNICVHKGLPLPVMGKETYKYASPKDVGPAAKNNPDMTFMIYHSGYEHKKKEGPYNPNAEKLSGIDTLIKSLQDNNIPRNTGNVYAELGSTWRDLMKDPDQAGHAIGKLLKYVGEDRILWGTDCIWYGSPQDQIQAFRTFQISEEYQEKYGYPKMTPEARAKIFGLNAAVPYGISTGDIKVATLQDTIAVTKENYLNNPEPSFVTYGPKTRREFLALQRLEMDELLSGR
ncbi:amidohydrolase family protein [Oceanicoccus sagamiensis]|uniref:Amidohydrolase-related domain-containing protein n=1 Tax=Oceanicoccus sagamiensis TaxID=716816 RepID=A0A1X9NEM8_9GAMM|nr:amidohydrolase family protein [Oceanicoccus sagamiensis]ARN73397.1 hypothetical protein BST96_04285 [Oceanicoccus sagamiensis]